MNHALEGKIHGLWSVARVKRHALEATVTMETVASRASGPVKEVQGSSDLTSLLRTWILTEPDSMICQLERVIHVL